MLSVSAFPIDTNLRGDEFKLSYRLCTYYASCHRDIHSSSVQDLNEDFGQVVELVWFFRGLCPSWQGECAEFRGERGDWQTIKDQEIKCLDAGRGVGFKPDFF